MIRWCTAVRATWQAPERISQPSVFVGAPQLGFDSRGNGLVLRGNGSDLGVLQVLPELDKLQKGELESRLSVQYDDKYGWFAWPAFVLLTLGAMLGDGALLRRRTA